MLGCRRIAVLFAALVALFVAVPLGDPPSASAHVRASAGYASARSVDGGVHLDLDVEYALLARAAGLGHGAITAGDDVARANALVANQARVEAYLAKRVRLYIDDVSCEPAIRASEVVQRQGMSYAGVALHYHCPGAAQGGYELEYEVFSATDALVDDHSTVLEYDVSGSRGTVVLDRAHPSVTLGEGSALGTAARFTTLGVEHILLGTDHVLFVLALLLGVRRVRDVVEVATTFTLAHSLTLALAVLGLVNVPAWLVEPLIALSIAFVALENLLGGAGRHRLAIVFGFGLLHGLGFAGSLQIDDEVSWDLVLSLLTFNVGIEIGQVVLVAMVLPLLLLLRRASWSVLFYASATTVVAAFGLFWFVERVAAA